LAWVQIVDDVLDNVGQELVNNLPAYGMKALGHEQDIAVRIGEWLDQLDKLSQIDRRVVQREQMLPEFHLTDDRWAHRAQQLTIAHWFPVPFTIPGISFMRLIAGFLAFHESDLSFARIGNGKQICVSRRARKQIIADLVHRLLTLDIGHDRGQILVDH